MDITMDGLALSQPLQMHLMYRREGVLQVWDGVALLRAACLGDSYN